MPATAVYQLPYPAPADPADVPLDMQELAERIEAAVGPGTLTGQIPVWDQTSKTWKPSTGLPYIWGRTNQTFDSSGLTTITHNLGRVPVVMLAMAGAPGNLSVTQHNVAATSTTFMLRAIVCNTNANFTGALLVNWFAA